MNKYQQTCRQHILDTIDDLVGYELEVSELGMRLTEGENADGSWYCSTYKAEQDLDAFGRDAIAEFIENYKSEYGAMPYDAYVEPESFHCLMMIIGVEQMVNELGVVSENWDKHFDKVSQKFVNSIKSELEAMQ